MATFITFTGLTGAQLPVDVELVTNIADTPADECLVQGVSRGTRIVSSAPPGTFDVQESVLDVATAVAQANAIRDGIGNSVSSVPVANQVLNAAGPTPSTFSVVAPSAGTYLVSFHGNVQTTDVINSGASIRARVNAAGIGDEINWPGNAVGGDFIANNTPAMNLGQLGTQLLTLAAGDVVGAMIGVLPGGVGGDDVTVIGGGVTIVKIT